MAWNLADQLNTDMDSESLLDSRPSAVDQLRKEEAVRVIDSGGDLNENSKGSFVSGSNIAPLEDIKTRASANSESRRVKAEETSNPLDNFEPVKQAPQPKKELTIGEIVADGYSLIGQVQKLKNGRTGANAREVAREKAIDEQFIGQVYSRMGDLFEERNMDRNLVSRLGALPGGGFRTAEEIDRVDRIRREGAVLKDDNGNEVVIEKGLDWDRAFEADKLVWAQELKSRTKGAGASEGDIVGEINKINTAVKSISDEYGNALQGKEAEYESLTSRKDALLKLPTGVSRYSDRLSRLEDREARMNNAVVAGVGYGEISKENLPQEIARLKQQQVALAVDNAPYFKDRETLKSWASDKNTRRLPFFTDANGARVLARMSDDPNVLSVWAPTQNDWIPLDLNKDAPTAETKTTNPLSSNEAGKKLNKLTAPIADLTSRYTPQELFEKAGDRVIDAGLNIGDYLATGVRNNVLAPALEFSAGASGKELDLEDLPNPSFKDRKWKNLTPKERAALLGRSSPGLTTMEAVRKAK
jgi:hypothetical protein